MKSLSRDRLFATPWTAAHQAPPSKEFSRQEYWSGLPLPFPFPRGNISINLCAIRLGSGFLAVTPKAQATNGKTDSLGIIKMKKKNWWKNENWNEKKKASKDTIEKVKRQPTEWEQTFANHISDERLVFRIHKELLQLDSKRWTLKPEQKIWIDISPKKIDKWPINVWKDTQYH